MSFLEARWSNLVLITFAVPDEWIRPLVPSMLDLDRFEGNAHVSLVAFQFRDTRVAGLRVPGHVNFPEVNLRTYVRYGDKRGVFFLREWVPKRLVVVVARLLYNEPYAFTPMRDQVTHDAAVVRASFQWGDHARPGAVSVTGSAASRVPPSDSVEHHFKEHQWGYGRTRGGELLEYRVQHPVWAVRDIISLSYEIDFGALYGPRWASLSTQAPRSTIFAVGSSITVDRAQRAAAAGRP